MKRVEHKGQEVSLEIFLFRNYLEKILKYQAAKFVFARFMGMKRVENKGSYKLKFESVSC